MTPEQRRDDALREIRRAAYQRKNDGYQITRGQSRWLQAVLVSKQSLRLLLKEIKP